MKCIKLMSIVVALFGITAIASAQTLQEVTEARNKGSELMAAGDLDGAIAELEKCVDLAKKVGDDAEEHQVVAESALPGLYFRKANAILTSRDYPATIVALEATIAAAVKYKSDEVKERAEKTIPQVYQQLGAADFSAQKYAEAIVNFDKALAYDPNVASIYYFKGACYQNLKDEAQMEENYKLAIEKGTASNDANNVQRSKTALSRYFLNIGIAAQRAQKWDDAIAAFTKTVEADDQNVDAFYSLAVCYDNKKSWDNVISNSEKALELGASGDRVNGIHFYMGNAYAGKNTNAKACEYYKKVGEGSFLAAAKYQIETVLKCN